MNRRELCMNKAMLLLLASLPLPVQAMYQKVGNTCAKVVLVPIKAYEVIELIDNDKTADLEQLLNAGFNPDIKNHYGDTPLHHAAEEGKAMQVQLLLKSSKINVNARNNCGETPLYRAALHNKLECVKLLLAHEKIIAASKDGFNAIPLDPALSDEMKALLQAAAHKK